MTKKSDPYLTIVKYLLPEELFDYFDLVQFEEIDNQIHIYLDEEDIKPEEYKSEKLTSKGFHSPIIIQDFPIRDKPSFLHIRRRRWLVESSGEVISRNWDSVAKGTRLTKDFATFLKGLFGQLPNKQ